MKIRYIRTVTDPYYLSGSPGDERNINRLDAQRLIDLGYCEPAKDQRKENDVEQERSKTEDSGPSKQYPQKGKDAGGPADLGLGSDGKRAPGLASRDKRPAEDGPESVTGDAVSDGDS